MQQKVQKKLMLTDETCPKTFLLRNLSDHVFHSY